MSEIMNFKIRVKTGEVEVKVDSSDPILTKKWFDELAKKYLR